METKGFKNYDEAVNNLNDESFTLLDLDNYCCLGDNDSIFGCGEGKELIKELRENKKGTFSYNYSDYGDNPNCYNVFMEMVENSDDDFRILVKVVGVDDM